MKSKNNLSYLTMLLDKMLMGYQFLNPGPVNRNEIKDGNFELFTSKKAFNSCLKILAAFNLK